MNLDHLTYFKTLVELGSRSETAERLSITPSTLSLCAFKLEQEVGVPPFQKKRGSVELTSEGETFYEYVETSLRFPEQRVEIAPRKAGGVQGEIVIGTVFSVQSKDWSRIINRFRLKTHGDVLIRDRSIFNALVNRRYKEG